MKKEMTIEDAKAFKAALYKEPVKVLSEKDKREQFRLFWAVEKKNYKKEKALEPILWMHLVSTGNDSPKDFLKGLSNFGLKKI